MLYIFFFILKFLNCLKYFLKQHINETEHFLRSKILNYLYIINNLLNKIIFNDFEN